MTEGSGALFARGAQLPLAPTAAVESRCRSLLVSNAASLVNALAIALLG